MGFREDRKISVNERLPLPAHVEVEGSTEALRMGVGEED
jgi:Fe2+ transport system protein FeoA